MPQLSVWSNCVSRWHDLTLSINTPSALYDKLATFLAPSPSFPPCTKLITERHVYAILGSIAAKLLPGLLLKCCSIFGTDIVQIMRIWYARIRSSAHPCMAGTLLHTPLHTPGLCQTYWPHGHIYYMHGYKRESLVHPRGFKGTCTWPSLGDDLKMQTRCCLNKGRNHYFCPNTTGL